MRRCFLPSVPVLALASLLALAASASAFAVSPNRIASVVDAKRVALPNNISGRLKHATDMGAAPGNHMMTGVTLRFSMTTAQQAALSQLLVDQQNPASPRYHQWLTPEQFAADFGLSTTDIAKVSAWLSSQGLTVTEIGRSGSFIRASGTVAQVEAAFGTSIHNVESRGEENISNISEPQLPAAIASVVTGITGFNDFKAKPRLKHAAVNPAFTSSTSGKPLYRSGRFLHDL